MRARSDPGADYGWRHPPDAMNDTPHHHHRADATLFFEIKHFPDHTERLLAGRLDKSAGVDDHDTGTISIGLKGVPILCKLAQHALGIDQIFGATQAHKGEGALVGVC